MIRRVLLAPINADHPQRGLEAAFNGIFGPDNVRVFDYMELHRQGQSAAAVNTALVETARAHEPDWIWLQLQDIGTIQPQTLHELAATLPRTVISHWTGDMRLSISYASAICAATHITFASSHAQLADFVAAGAAAAHYCQIGVDFEEDILGLPAWTPPFSVPEVVFCGHYYGRAFRESRLRLDAISHLRRHGINVGVVGGGWPTNIPVAGRCEVKQQHHVWRRAEVGLNINHFNNVAGYYSDRQLIAMGSGTPLVCHYIPGLEREFENGVHCMWYTNPPELLNAVQTLLADPDLRRQIGEAGRAEVIRRHSWFSRILDLLPIVEARQRALT